MPIGGDQPHGLVGEAATGEGGEEGLPGALTLGADEAIVDHLAAAGVGNPEGHQDQAALGPLGRFHPQGEPIEDQVAVLILEGPGVPGDDGLIERAGDA